MRTLGEYTRGFSFGGMMSDQETIQVVVVEPGKEPELRTIQRGLSPLQEIVGGYIEGLRFPWDDRYYCYLHGEGKFEQLPWNFLIPEYADVVVGPVVIVGCLPADGEDHPLDEADLNIIRQALQEKAGRILR